MMLAAVFGRVRRAAHILILGVLGSVAPCLCSSAATLTLGWDSNGEDPAVAGYRLYYGCSSRTYTNLADAGLATSVTLSNLSRGVTYWFAATCYSPVGLESEYSTETSYTVPVLNWPPTLNQPADVAVAENAGAQTVNLTGISSGSVNENQTLVVSAFSSNPNLVPNPIVTYTSPANTGTISFQPAANSFGAVTITVLVDDGGAVNNTVIRTFHITVNPVNDPPTLDPIAELVLNENSSPATVNLTGITSGATNENETLSVTATSSNSGLIPNPVVSYTSPAATGSLRITPATNAYGSATITVVVSDNQPVNSTTTRTFNVRVNQVTTSPNTITNVVIAPNDPFRLVLAPPSTNGHRFTYSLEAGAPAGARITTRRGISSLVWVPTSAQASTTNLINIRITDTTVAAMSTNAFVQVIVLDYLDIIPGKAAVQAGQSGSLPLSIACSDGLTNVSFLLPWPSSRFTSPALSMVSSNFASGSVQVQGANLLVRLHTTASRPFEGSNVVARLNFSAVSGQTSAFVEMAASGISGAKPTGRAYVDALGQRGQLAVVGAVPLLESAVESGNLRTLSLYGRVGIAYELQYCTNGLNAAPVWRPLLNYTQTNVAQKLTTDSANPVILYRLKQQ